MSTTEETSIILEELLEMAAEATQPPTPPEKIIRQFVPVWIRKVVKSIALPLVLLDSWMQRLAKKIIRPPVKRRGKCLQRGNCCHYVLIAYSKTMVGKLFYFWYTQIHGFYPRLKRPHLYEGKKMHVMGCRYLSSEGKCLQYRLRPLICRQWPVIEYFGYPKILKGCGFYADPPLDSHSNNESKEEESSLPILQ